MGNVAGAFENAMLGELFPPLPKNIIPLLMQVAAKQRDHLELRKSAQTTDHTVERSFYISSMPVMRLPLRYNG